jgi:hypothetical protein
MQNQQRHDSTSYAEVASERLWDRFGEMFGARFYDQFGKDPSTSWKDAVKELRPDQVKAALTRVRNSGAQYPPGLPEFVAMAKCQRIAQPEAPKPEYDHFHCFGQLQFFRFLQLHEVRNAELPALIRRKNEIIDAARHDPDMQPGGDEAEMGKQLHEILFDAWLRALAS